MGEVLPRSFSFLMAGIYVALFIIRPWEELLPWLQNIQFERVYAILMICVALIASAGRFRFSKQTVAVFLFMISMVLSAQFAVFPELCGKYVYRYGTLVAFYVVLTLVIRDPYQLVWMVSFYIATMWLYLAKALWEFYVHGAGTRMMGVLRLQGIESSFGFPNDLAFSISISLPMALFLYSVRQQFTCEWPRSISRVFALGVGTYALLALWSIILTNSRSGMLSVVLLGGLVAIRGKRLGGKISFALAGIVLLAGIWMFLPAEIRGRYQTIWDPDSGPHGAKTSAEGRWQGFLSGLQIVREYPLLGIGAGNFIDYRVKYLDGVALNPHNLPGQILAEGGVVGTACFLLLVFIILANCHRMRRLARDSSDTTLIVLDRFALAAKDSTVVLMFEGLANHNVDRFNWLWLAAFCCLGLEYAKTAADSGVMPYDQPDPSY